MSVVTAGEILWKVLVAGLILVAGGTFGSWAVAAVSTALEHAGVEPLVRRTIARLVRPIILLVSFVAALEYLDVDLTTVAAMTGAATLAIGLALQHSLSNVASGAMLMTLRPFREGEIIECAGELGVVLEHGTFAIVIERPDGTLVTIPNQAAFTGILRNHSRRGARRIELSVLVPLDTDLVGLRAKVLPLLMAESRVLEQPPPDLSVGDIEDRGVRLQIHLWTSPADYLEVRASVAEALVAVLRQDREQSSRLGVGAHEL